MDIILRGKIYLALSTNVQAFLASCPCYGHSLSPSLQDWKDDRGGVGRVVVHLLVGDTQRRRGGQRPAAARVMGEAGMGTAGNLELDAVPTAEARAGWPQLDADGELVTGHFKPHELPAFNYTAF
jgi:hypothetical protein